jgi:hypothetical protein
MRLSYKEYTIDIIDDSNYTLNSADNVISYDKEYFDGMLNTDRVYPTAKHGIRISRDGDELASAIIVRLEERQQYTTNQPLSKMIPF